MGLSDDTGMDPDAYEFAKQLFSDRGNHVWLEECPVMGDYIVVTDKSGEMVATFGYAKAGALLKECRPELAA